MNTLTQPELMQRARERIAKGALPCGPAKRYAGFGGPDPCALCDLPIGATEVVYESEMETQGGKRVIHLHRHCEEIWHEACRGDAERAPGQ